MNYMYYFLNVSECKLQISYARKVLKKIHTNQEEDSQNDTNTVKLRYIKLGSKKTNLRCPRVQEKRVKSSWDIQFLYISLLCLRYQCLKSKSSTAYI